MLKLIPSYFLFLVGFGTAVLAAGSEMFAKTHYPTVDRSSVLIGHVAAVTESLVEVPGQPGRLPSLEVPAPDGKEPCEIWIRIGDSIYPRTLTFRLRNRKAVRYRAFTMDGGDRIPVFDSKTALDGDVQRVPLPGDAKLILSTSARDRGHGSPRGAWIDLRIEYDYTWLWVAAAASVVLATALLLWWVSPGVQRPWKTE